MANTEQSDIFKTKFMKRRLINNPTGIIFLKSYSANTIFFPSVIKIEIEIEIKVEKVNLLF